MELRLLSALEILEARREAAQLAESQGERALCSNACLLARALESGEKPVFDSGRAVLAGLTVSEIAAAGLPALFVPFQHKDRQQYWNALPLEKAGAAKIFEQPQFTADAVATTLAGWNRDALLEMAQRARAVAIPDATERVAKEVSLAAQA